MFFSRMESLRLHLFVKDSCWLYLRLCSSLFTAPLVLLKLFFAAVLFSFPLYSSYHLLGSLLPFPLGFQGSKKILTVSRLPNQRDVHSFFKTVMKNFRHTLHLNDSEQIPKFLPPKFNNCSFCYFCFSDIIYMYDICILFAESFESESTTIVTLCS